MNDTPALDISPITTRASGQEMAKLFPGCDVELDWLAPQAGFVAPLFAMRMLLGASWESAPGGHNYVCIQSEGRNFVITPEDFKLVRTLVSDFQKGFLKPRGFPLESSYLRKNPEVMLQGLWYMHQRVNEAFDIKPDEARIFWMIPDTGACGYYRAELPVKHIREHYGVVIDAQAHYNERYLGFYDAAIFHRVPSAQSLAALQRMKHEGRVVVYDTDDDIFSVPEWSIMHESFNKEAQQRTSILMEFADIISVSTQHLAQKFERTHHITPNLLMTSLYRKCDRRGENLPAKLLGKKITVQRGSGYRLQDVRTGVYSELTNDRPLNVVWYGSNTHDGDLVQIVEPIKEIIKTFGVAVRFTFFGYCPMDFLDAHAGSGNSGLRLTVKEEYAHNVIFVSPVPLNKFSETLQALHADIGLCPIKGVDFNLAKSNLKAIEFGAMGVAVVASNFGPYKFIDDGVNGLLVEQDDAKGWVQAIAALLRDRALRLQVGDNLYETVNDLYSWETDNSNRRKWDAFFEDIIHRSLTARKREADGLQADTANQTTGVLTGD